MTDECHVHHLSVDFHDAHPTCTWHPLQDSNHRERMVMLLAEVGLTPDETSAETLVWHRALTGEEIADVFKASALARKVVA